MADSAALKALLNGMHDAVRWVLHIVLIPVVAALKALISGISYMHDELAKV